MTIKVIIKNDRSAEDQAISVRRVDPSDPANLVVEDEVLLQSGQEREFYIWGSWRIAIEEKTFVKATYLQVQE